MRTFFLKKKQINKKWLIIDADHVVVGRLASFVAKLLRGKHKSDYTPHMDCGDYVIIVNANKIHLTGKKLQDKIYYRHTGYPGGLKQETPLDILNSKFPEKIIKMAVKRMLDSGPLARRRFENLYVYSGPEHKHQGQQPERIDFASFNTKNKK
ncbi:50S ribosomal protein L13 [Wolbachia endosymbiont of Howardula sp.]|uniref:50S ribosomal protein L13 n=1 Tax=Wolbachia endosymbiont of Howardula sp. TaxID=2916816 RepID=UPI00217D3B3A|nr:50S ribosomal protein L13 [Wolbachia endosymbiont of Howardula sp.]UWI83254.1 50S ribosomal protein L13 [Wolbachia endosymbiont of Howardula sp.]